MINIVQNEDKYEISFRYDPYVIDIVKSVPGRRWNPDRKLWTISRDKLGWLLSRFEGTIYESNLNIQSNESLNVNRSIDVTSEIPEVDISDVPFYVKEGATPYPHQLDFMKWAIDRQRRGNMKGFLLADEQGLAKSAESMNLALYNRANNNFKHCLIICCINGSKFNWKNDIADHTRGAEVPYILGTRIKRDGSLRQDTSSKDKYDDLSTWKKFGKDEDLPYFLILNIEALRYKVGKGYPIADVIIERIKSGDINTIIIDEIHKNASPSSMQGKQLLRIKKQTLDKCMWIPISGTPITKKPTDAFTPLRLVEGHSFTSYWKWCQEFCVYGGYGDYEIIGYKNIPKLKKMLEHNMIRRLKADVIKDMPPKIRYTEYVINTPYQEKLYKKVAGEVRSQKDEILRQLNPMTQFLRLRQVNGSPELVDPELNIDNVVWTTPSSVQSYLSKNAKLQRLAELLEEIHERGEKVIIFSNWVEPLRTLYKFIRVKYKVCAYVGTMDPEERDRQKHIFQTNPEYTVMIGTIGAMGTTHTLTAATNVIFFDDPWNPSDKEQAEDRAHRIGTQYPVNIYTIVTVNTVDEKVQDILYTKQGISKYIVDNKLDLRNNPQLFDLLLSDTK